MDQLAAVLSHVPIHQRLSTCSLVSSSWRTAAALATTSIARVFPAISYIGGLPYKPALGAWLRKHGQQVTELHMFGTGAGTSSLSEATVRLCVAQLSSLKVLDISSLPWEPELLQSTTSTPSVAPYSSALPSPTTTSNSTSKPDGGLERLTSLTQLRLSDSSVRLAGLAALTRLQALTLEGQQQEVAGSSWFSPYRILRDESAELSEALPHLQQLTSLQLGGALATTAIGSRTSCLQSLQQLILTDTTADNYAALPTSLTLFSLSLAINRAEPPVLTRSNAAGLSQLTALQSLELKQVKVFDLALLFDMRCLQALSFHGLYSAVEYTAGGPSLQLVSSFTALTSLTISGQASFGRQFGRSPASITAAEAPALTASSKLAVLQLRGKPGQLQPQDYASLFPPGRHLQHLTMLELCADILGNTTAVQQARSCCPNLHTVHLIWPGCDHHGYWTPINAPDPKAWTDGEAALVTASLREMAGWQQLRELRLLSQAYGFPAAFWAALGTCSQLTHLLIHCWPQTGMYQEDVMCLEGCKALQKLNIRACDQDRMWELDIESQVRSVVVVVVVTGWSQWFGCHNHTFQICSQSSIFGHRDGIL